MTCNLQVRARIVLQACVVCCLVFLLAGLCFSQAAISLSPASGPPTTSLRVSGSGFAPYAKIDIFFDTQDLALALADRSGSFSQIAVTAPASALPGEHWVSAVQRFGHAGAQTIFLVQTPWAQFHRSNMERWNQHENVLNIHNVGALQVKWSYYLGETDSSPAVENGVVYAGTYTGLLYAFKVSTGAVQWTFQTASDGRDDSSPAIAKGVVYYGSYDGKLYALKATTGAKLWSFQTGATVTSSPTVIDGVVYIGSNDGNVYALKANTGAKLWKYTTGGIVSCTPAVVDGVVYFGSYDGNVYAVKAKTGAKLWSYYVGGSQSPWVSSSPAVANGLVYIGSGNTNELYALKASTGAVAWVQSIGEGYVQTSSPAVANGIVYMGSGDDNLYAMDAKTGVVLWTYNTGNDVGMAPAVANGVVYFGTNNWIFYAVNATTGALLWSFDTSAAAAASPAVSDGVVYFSADGGNFYAFSLPKNKEEGATSKAPDLKRLEPDSASRYRSQPQLPWTRNSEECRRGCD